MSYCAEERATRTARWAAQPRSFAFLLTPNLSMIAFASALEPLRIANRVTHRTCYAWTLHSADGAPVRCSNGVEITVDSGLDEIDPDAILFVCSGIDAGFAATRPVLNWLRRQNARGVPLGAVCTGSYVLAKAGLLNHRRCTIHWESLPAVAEEFPSVRFTSHLFEIDGDRYTCAGGAAASDMMLQIISNDYGDDLSSMVADMILYSARGSGVEQRLSIPGRYGVRHPKLITVIRAMEMHIEDPIRPSALAEQAGMSTRQLERLFRRYLNRSPKRYYMELRLQRARNLLLQTEMSVINVALACGFASPSHFSKCYRQYFERTPYRDRGTPEALASARRVPQAHGVRG